LRADALPVANQPPVCRNVFATRWLRESASPAVSACKSGVPHFRNAVAMRWKVTVQLAL
jgi:hypothetical protein